MIDCHQCKHYYVTWDKKFPCGCHAMKFKSRQLPATVVRRSSGIDCLLYKSKSRPQHHDHPPKANRTWQYETRV